MTDIAPLTDLVDVNSGTCSFCKQKFPLRDLWSCKTCKSLVCHPDLGNHKCENVSQVERLEGLLTVKELQQEKDLDEEVSGSEMDDAADQDFD